MKLTLWKNYRPLKKNRILLLFGEGQVPRLRLQHCTTLRSSQDVTAGDAGWPSAPRGDNTLDQHHMWSEFSTLSVFTPPATKKQSLGGTLDRANFLPLINIPHSRIEHPSMIPTRTRHSHETCTLMILHHRDPPQATSCPSVADRKQEVCSPHP